MNKKAAFSAAVLLAMGSTGAATAGQIPGGNGILDIPLPGTIEYESASKLVNESLIVSVKAKKKTATKKKAKGCSRSRIPAHAKGRCPSTKKIAVKRG